MLFQSLQRRFYDVAPRVVPGCGLKVLLTQALQEGQEPRELCGRQQRLERASAGGVAGESSLNGQYRVTFLRIGVFLRSTERQNGVVCVPLPCSMLRNQKYRGHDLLL